MTTGPPASAVDPVDVHVDGVHAAWLWRTGEAVTFAYRDDHVARGGRAVATSLPLAVGSSSTDRLRLPPFFVNLLPEGDTRQEQLRRSYRLAPDDELGLLARVGADLVGDVQVVPSGTALPDDTAPAGTQAWSDVSFAELWRALPDEPERAGVPGVQPKMSARSRSLASASTGQVLLKFALDGWHGALENEAFFLRHAAAAGLDAADAAVVADRDGVRALAVARFDRHLDDGRLVRHAQEDGCQVLGLRPAQKYDPDARAVVRALAARCAAPPVAVRDLVHQLAWCYAAGDNDVHAKNLSIGTDPSSGLWRVTPLYDVLHTYPYEGDHRFWPGIGAGGPHDAVTRRHWAVLADDLGLPRRALDRVLDRVCGGMRSALAHTDELSTMPRRWVADLERRVRRRVRDLEG